jgi:uncharacterized protein (DUF58 family)
MPVALTGAGFRFALLVGIVTFAAYSNQNNLLYLMAAVGLASVLICPVAGWASLRGVHLAGAEMPDAYADVPFREKLILASSTRALHAFGITVDGAVKPVPFLRPGHPGTAHVEHLFRRRGRYSGGPLKVSTRFPFGFFRLRRKLHAPRDILVFPRIQPVDVALVNASRAGMLSRSRRRGQGDEFYRLREYASGDHVHHIHWKSSAKLDEMMVREFGEHEQERLCLGFVPVFPDQEDSSEFEHLVSAAASLATHLQQGGVQFRFLAEELELAPSSSREHIRGILTYLAEVAPTSELDASFAASAKRALARGETLIVVAFDSSFRLGTTLAPHQLLRRAS